MAIENLTLFELHFDRAQFGPASLGGSDGGVAVEDVEPTDETAEMATTDRTAEVETDAPGRAAGRFVLFGVGLGLAVAAALVARRRGDDGIEVVDDESAVDPAEQQAH